MSWCNPHVSMIPLAFVREDAQGLHHNASAELFPSRLHAPEGLLHGIRGLAATMLAISDGSNWNPNVGPGLNGIGNGNTPFLSIQPGGATISRHPALPGASVWRVSETHVHEPDGTAWPRDSFAAPYAYPAAHGAGAQAWWHARGPFLIDIIIGGALLGMQGQRVDFCTVPIAGFVATVAPLITPKPRQPRSTAAKAHSHATTMATRALEEWHLAPDRMWMPQRFVVGNWPSHLIAQSTTPQAEELMGLSQEAFGLFFSYGREVWDAMANWGDPSAHTRILAAKAKADVEHHLYQKGPLWFSKPRRQ